jgi:hypothetical protein
MSYVSGDLMPGAYIPDSNRAILTMATTCRILAVSRNIEAQDAGGVAAKTSQFLSTLEVPNANCFVVAIGQRQIARRGESNPTYFVLVPS